MLGLWVVNVGASKIDWWWTVDVDFWDLDFEVVYNKSDFQGESSRQYLRGWLITLSKPWDIQKLNEIFIPEDVEVIKIPVSLTNRVDCWIWHYDKRSVYLVKSDYKCAMFQHTLNRGTRSNVWSNWWSCLWKLKLPSNIAIFVWKTCHENIPTFVPLRKRGIGARSWCLVCRRNEETICHALFGCCHAKSVWNLFFWLWLGCRS